MLFYCNQRTVQNQAKVICTSEKRHESISPYTSDAVTKGSISTCH